MLDGPYLMDHKRYVDGLLASKTDDMSGTYVSFANLGQLGIDITKTKILIELIVANSHLDNIDHMLKTHLSHELSVYGYDVVYSYAERVLDILDDTNFSRDYLLVVGWNKHQRLVCLIVESDV
jgi:hypothetical protein